MTKPAGDLEMEQDLKFQRREWVVQRVGWAVLAGFVVAAAAGVFGDGPLSAAQAGQAGDAIWIEYERFVRVGAATRMKVHVQPEPGALAFVVQMNRDYFNGVRIARFFPEPERTAIDADAVTMHFALTNDQAEGIVVMDLEPLTAGRRAVRIGTSGQPGVAFTQLTYF